MFKKKRQPPAIASRLGAEEEEEEGHAYEDAWYRSLRAKADQRAEDGTAAPEQDEPEAPPNQEPVSR